MGWWGRCPTLAGLGMGLGAFPCGSVTGVSKGEQHGLGRGWDLPGPGCRLWFCLCCVRTC